ncbi:hypothetical protein PM082_004506 [Marasmius tenuissimus]|nr:hypothetical protein PM082_004506 [Marasmius tenuissimus]
MVRRTWPTTASVPFGGDHPINNTERITALDDEVIATQPQNHIPGLASVAP